jgi:radical SAM superfamily enzyme YgiQ (UPF0313 family)
VNILFINPFQYLNVNKFMHRVFPVANLTPSYLASLIPVDHIVRIIDEARQKVDFDTPADLVCISTITVNAKRAYAIADRFREKGVRVVLGGSHASALPEEAKQHCDAVAIGNAETMIAKIIGDAQTDDLQPYYHNRIPDALPQQVSGTVRSNWQTSILASRGCELSCNFCSSQNVFGKFWLQRELDTVLNDIENLETRYVNFLDDNFYGASPAANAYYDRILEVLERKNTRWMGQVRLPILTDEVLDKFSQSNCIGFLVGFESINPNNTADVGKKVNVAYFREQIARIQSKKIGVFGSFIFGFDEDTPETIDETVKFCIDSKMEMAAFSVLTPYPGTKVYNDLKEEGRILSEDWNLYDTDKVVYQPKNFTARQLEEHLVRATRKFYSTASILRRMKFRMNYSTFKHHILPNALRNIAMKLN